jgi:peptidyl-prolyl cis-trans isomerase A (cyclophilin A)
MMFSLAATVVVALFTSAGEIDIAVDQLHAPKTAANFLTYMRRGAFDGGRFFRTVLTHPDNQPHNRVKIDVIQADNKPGFVSGPPVAFEPTSVTGLRLRDGTVSMARDAAVNTATTNFFICIGDQPSLDDGGGRSKDRRGFAAFGQVVRGMNVVRAIHDDPHAQQTLAPPIVIRRAQLQSRTVSGERTPTATQIALARMRPPLTKNTIPKPKRAASAPPESGPRNIPMNEAL